MSDVPHVLFVDDEERVLKSLRRHFLDEGYELLFAASGAQGLELLAQTAVDVVVSDFRMPNMNGAEFLKRVSEEWPDTIRMVLSGYADISALITAINEGDIFKFIGKPWQENELKDAVKQAIEKRKAMTEMRELAERALTVSNTLFEYERIEREHVIDRNMSLESSAQRLQAYEDVFQSLGIPIAICNSEGNFADMNKAFMRFLQSAGNGSAVSATQPKLPSGFTPFVQEAIESGKTGETRRRIVIDNHEFEIALYPVLGNRNNARMALVIDYHD